ncbi:AraC family transcriptional regulator [Paenibacillus mucilaginosus]|uniref:Transcriptional regulator, AraC family n=1 Tax=Paenibacillus mucilaginosus (strain KNP414) TaxID=1036673 RepID=F8FQA7_PAEMK|nr:AraC family transcriptional regulator [Paenibacillus mucilaginosus]AEI40327.1 transcriptional regulator, AraC family [Paenibacillus mucilaginosus KNP414]
MILHIAYEDKELPVNIFKWIPLPSLEQQHHHPCFEMGMCISGRGTFHFGTTVYPVAPGDIFIVHVLESHIAQSHPDHPCEFLFLNFDAELLEKEEPELMVPFRYYPFHFRNRLEGDGVMMERLRVLIRQIYEEKRSMAPGYRTAVKSLLLSICVELLRMSKEEISSTIWMDGMRKYEHVRPVLQYIETHYQKDIDLTRLAQLFHISQSHLSRLILEATGRKFKSHIVTLRIQHAKRLLAGTSMNVTEICFDCGFQSMASFYRNFKQYVQMSPEDYRRTVLTNSLSIRADLSSVIG